MKRSLQGIKGLFKNSGGADRASVEEVTSSLKSTSASRKSIDSVLAGQLLRFWHEISDLVRKDPNQSENSGIRQRLGQLEERIAALGDDGTPDLALSRDITGFLALVTTTRYETALSRIEELTTELQERERSAGAKELTSRHAQDEKQRCHRMIEEEYLRRGLKRPEGPAPENIYDHLAAFFCALDASDKLPVMGAVLSDPVLQALEKLIETPDPTTLKTFPEWMKRPAARILDLIAERNRYRRLLEHAGMLPPQER
jgi:hypothetical protein